MLEREAHSVWSALNGERKLNLTPFIELASVAAKNSEMITGRAAATNQRTKPDAGGGAVQRRSDVTFESVQLS
jgi:hypothetical protein